MYDSTNCAASSWLLNQDLGFFEHVLGLQVSVQGWKINRFLSEVLVCWSCAEKITIKIERAFSVTLWALPATRRSFQQSPQLPTVTATSSSCCNLQQLLWPLETLPHSFPRGCFQVPNWEVVSKSPEVVSSDRIVQLYYNSNILRFETAIIVETAIRVKTAIISQLRCTSSVFSKLFQIVSSCFELFQVVQIVITLGQQPACRPMIVICLINKVCDQFNT